MTKDEDIRKVQDAIRAGDMENCDAYKWARSWGDLSVPAIVSSKEREEMKLFEMTLKDAGKEIFDFLSSKHGYLVNYNLKII